MQEYSKEHNIFFYESEQGGHGGNKTIRDMSEERMMIFSFIRRVLNM